MSDEVLHTRVQVYAATRAVLLDANVVPSDQIFVERTESVQVFEKLPAVFIGAGTTRLERDGGTAKFKGAFRLSIQIIVRGDDGFEAARERDAVVVLIKRALLAGGSVWPRWTGETTPARDRPMWDVIEVEETATRGKSEGHELLSSAVLELTLKIAEVVTDLPEDAVALGSVRVTTKRDAPTEDTGDEPLMENEVTP